VEFCKWLYGHLYSSALTHGPINLTSVVKYDYTLVGMADSR
jgi:hypothetical protein